MVRTWMMMRSNILVLFLVCILIAAAMGCDDDDDDKDDDVDDDDDAADDDDSGQAARRQSLNGTWKFKLDPNQVGKQHQWFAEDLDESDWVDIEVPGHWNYLYRDDPYPEDKYGDENINHDENGPGWYRTSFVPDAPQDAGYIKIHFGGVFYKTEVWLNGELVGGHEGGFLPFEFDLTDKLKAGTNNVLALYIETITLASQNTVPPTLGQYDYWAYSGVYRDVYLDYADMRHVFDVFVRAEPDGAKNGAVNVEATVLNAGESDADLGVIVRLFEKGQSTQLAQARADVTLPGGVYGKIHLALTLAQANLWTPKTPNLYDCRVELVEGTEAKSPRAGGALTETTPYDSTKELPGHAFLTPAQADGTLDATQVHFGVRKIEVQGRQILLNGERVIFKGINRHDEYPMLGRVMSNELLQEDLRMLKKANMNAYRGAHYPNDPRVYQFCDELGLMVIEEIPATAMTWEQMDNPKGRQLALDITRRMVLRDRNCPSIVIWSAGDEPEPYGKDDFNSELYQEMRDHDPTRLVGYARVFFDFIADDPDADVVIINPYWGWYFGEIPSHDWFMKFIVLYFPGKPVVLGEFGAGAIKDNRSAVEPGQSDHFTEDYQSYLLAETWAITAANEDLSGGFAWVYADFLSTYRKYIYSWQYPKSEHHINPRPWTNLKGIVDRFRTPKNAYLTTMGMYGDDPVYNLTVVTVDSLGDPVQGATVNLYLDDGTWVGNQVTNEDGEMLLWSIPGRTYTIEASTQSTSKTVTLTLDQDRTEQIELE